MEKSESRGDGYGEEREQVALRDPHSGVMVEECQQEVSGEPPSQGKHGLQSCPYGLSIKDVAKKEHSREERSGRFTASCLAANDGGRWRQQCMLGSTS